MKNEKNTANKPRTGNTTNLATAKLATSRKYMAIKKVTNATSVHSLAQKSQTLYRRATQKPINHSSQLIRKVGQSMDIARSKSISHFNPYKIEKNNTQQPTDIRPIQHSIIAKTKNYSIAQQIKPVNTKSLKIIKEEAIAEAMNKPVVRPKNNSFFKNHSKLVIISSLIIILIIIFGVFMNFFMPDLSVRIAGARAGISATYPTYQPDGYSFSGPVSYSNGEVTINFRANTGNTKFAIQQSSSSWDSTALKTEIDQDSDGDAVSTTSEHGLTIYTYNSHAEWVNGGILYSITGNAQLSNDQISRIANSM
jgi:hypothetical protein